MKKVLFIIVLLIAGFVGYHYYEKHEEVAGPLQLFGNVDIREVNLSFRVGGRIDRMLVDEGDQVKADQLIAVLDKEPFIDQVNVAKANVEAQRATLINAKLGYERSKDLLNKKLGSQQSVDDATAALNEAQAKLNANIASLELAETSLNDTDLKAPSNGTILTRIQEKGAIVAVGQPVYTLSLYDPVWIRAYVSETQLGRIFPGMKARVTTDAGQAYDGHIGFISPEAEFTPKTVETQSLRTDLVYRLRIVVDNPNNFLRQGMPVTVELIEHE